MKSFILKCLLFFALFFIIDKAFIFVRDSAPEREIDKRLEWVLNGKIDADIVVTGSSRGARDILASQIADSFKMSAYNLSYPGSNIIFHDYLLEKFFQFKNKIPKLIILAIDDPSAFKANTLINFRYDRLYPLVKYQDVRNTLIEKGEKDEILSDLFIIHQLLPSNFDFRKKHFDDLDSVFADGSMPISTQSKKFNLSFSDQYSVYDSSNEHPLLLNSFNHFIDLCKQHNVQLIITIPPNYRNATIGFKDRVDKLAGDRAFTHLYDTTNLVYKEHSVYYDENHLRKNTAIIFTSDLIGFIKRNHFL